METIELESLSIEQLEALCFRLVEQQTNVNNNLQVSQAQLNKKRQEAQNQTTLPVEPEVIERKDDGTDEEEV
jgi:hypothetical protein